MGISNHHAEARALHAQHTAQPGLIQPLDIASGTGHKHHSQGLGSQCLLTVLCCLGSAGFISLQEGVCPRAWFYRLLLPQEEYGCQALGQPRFPRASVGFLLQRASSPSKVGDAGLFLA